MRTNDDRNKLMSPPGAVREPRPTPTPSMPGWAFASAKGDRHPLSRLTPLAPTVLALQRTAGNHAVATAVSALQRFPTLKELAAEAFGRQLYASPRSVRVPDPRGGPDVPLTDVLPEELIAFLEDEGKASWQAQFDRLVAEHKACLLEVRALKDKTTERSVDTIRTLAVRLTSLKRQIEDFDRRLKAIRDELRAIDTNRYGETFFRRGTQDENSYLVKRGNDAASVMIDLSMLITIDEARTYLARLEEYIS